MACPIKDTCTFYNNQIHMLEERKKTIKTRFCLSSYAQCARFKIYEYFKSAQKVPPDLRPNDYERMEELIKTDKKHNKQ